MLENDFVIGRMLPKYGSFRSVEIGSNEVSFVFLHANTPALHEQTRTGLLLYFLAINCGVLRRFSIIKRYL